MDASILTGFATVLQPVHLLLLVISVFAGIVIGALPGLSGSTGIVLLLPFVIGMDSSMALNMMCGVFCGSMYGGSVSAILISTPGTPSAAATLLDGYPMAQRGEAGRALGVSTVASTAGGLISCVCLIFLAPQLARIGLLFGPVEYFALMVFGLTIIASVAGKSMVKGAIAGAFGLAVSLVGIDPTSGNARYTMDIPNLMVGFNLLPILIGLFAISQVFVQLEAQNLAASPVFQRLTKVLPRRSEWPGLIKVIIPSSLIGVIIGVIPGTGGAIASFLAYNEAKRLSRHPETFGQGDPEGIAAPEAANNGTTGGALVPMLPLGIPGDVVTAVMLGALLLIGVRPGPLLFKESPEVINAVFAGMLVANITMGVIGLSCLKVWPLVLKVPNAILYPSILALCFVGAYSLGNSAWHMVVALIFGVIGYLMRKTEFPAAPVILGVILGPLAEENLGRALISSHGDWTTLIHSPIAITFYVLAVISVAYSVWRRPGELNR
jgi:putative tricarboxylic transport membrane protein